MKKILFLFIFLVLAVGAFKFYQQFSMPNVNTEKNPISIKIPTGSSFDHVIEILKSKNALIDFSSFERWARIKKYNIHVKPGYYLLTKKMNNREIVNLLKGGMQTPVTLVIYDVSIKEHLSGRIGRTLELDSNKVLAVFNSDSFCKKWNTDTTRFLTNIIMDNYEFYWNASLNSIAEKFKKAHDDFWNEERKGKAELIGLTPEQVYILASIVEKECMRDKELPTVAGVYLNRLKIGMKLDADPTLKFALRDFDAKRVLNIHKEFDSPYNTYMYAGLPPGPICMPRKKTLNAVLNAEKHEYLFFCANPDMSGFSIFSKTYEEQIKVARLFQQKMNEMKIYK